MMPRMANDYESPGVQAVQAVLVELGQVLGAYREHFVVIGGAVPWLLLPDAQPPHLGTLDVDLNLDAEALGEGEYKGLIEALEASGYERAAGELKNFQLRRRVPVPSYGEIAVVVDLLMPKGAKFKKNRPRLMADLRVIEADGAGVALTDFVEKRIEGRMPDGRLNEVMLRIASIPALLVMKGYTLVGRDKLKDAYDIYYSIRNYHGGPAALAEACRPLLDNPVAALGYEHIAGKFRSSGDFGPETVRKFLEGSPAAGEMSPDQVQQDAYGQVRAWLDRLASP